MTLPHLLAPRMETNNHVHITKMIKHVTDDSGEGIILRKPKSRYESGRSVELYKLKVIRIQFAS